MDILSFDGDGRSGVMEAAILMGLAIMLWHNPTSLQYLIKNEYALKDCNIVGRLLRQLENIGDPIHPTAIYDMIVGTNTRGFSLIVPRNCEHCHFKILPGVTVPVHLGITMIIS